MNPWLRELVHTLAALAVEDVLAREGGGPDGTGPIGAQPKTASVIAASVTLIQNP